MGFLRVDMASDRKKPIKSKIVYSPIELIRAGQKILRETPPGTT